MFFYALEKAFSSEFVEKGHAEHQLVMLSLSKHEPPQTTPFDELRETDSKYFHMSSRKVMLSLSKHQCKQPPSTSSSLRCQLRLGRQGDTSHSSYFWQAHCLSEQLICNIEVL